MSFSNAQLAQKISDLIDYWSSFSVEYADWLGGTVSGGPNSDGQYPLTDYTGTETLVKSPAKLQDDVDNITTGATAQANAAAASAAAALTSENNAATSAATALSHANDADADRVAAAISETNATNAAVTSTTQANLATDRVGYASEWANAPFQTLVSSAAGGDQVDDYSALHWATVAEGFAGSIDSNLYGQLAQAETVPGGWNFTTTLGATEVRGNNLSYYLFGKVAAGIFSGYNIAHTGTVASHLLTGAVSGVQFSQSGETEFYNAASATAGTTATPRMEISPTGVVTIHGDAVFGSGTSYGTAVGASTTDLSTHLALYSTTYGINITSGSMNLVANSVNGASLASTGEWQMKAGAQLTGDLVHTDAYLDVKRSSAGVHGIRLIDSSSVVRGYIYANGSGQFGMLHSGGGWAFSMAAASNQVDFAGNITVAGTVDGVDIGANYANWNTAYSWGDHAGLYSLVSHNHAGVYEPVDANLVRSGTLTQADNYTYLNRNNASNPVLHVAQVGTGPIAKFGKVPTLGSTGYTAEITFGADGAITAEGLTANDVTQTARLNIVGGTSGNTHFNWSSNGENYITHKTAQETFFRSYDGVSAYTVIGKWDDSGLHIGDPATTYAAQLYLHGTTVGKIATLACTNGNLHIDSETGSATYINYYEGSNVYLCAGASAWHARVHSAGIYVTGTDTNPGATYSALSSNMLHIDGKETIDGNDTYLRLNQNFDYSSGVYTPGVFRVDGGLKLNADCTLSREASTQCRVTTAYGYTDIGPNNTSWAHFNTDRANFYFNKGAHFAAQPKFYNLGAIYYNGASTYASGKVTFSTGAATGGSSGDIWYQYT